MTDAVVIYRQQFQDYVEQVAKAQTARSVISEYANDARRQFEVIEQDMYNAARDEQLAKDILRGADPLSLAESASKLSKYMLDLRSNESLYIIDGTQEALDTWGQVNDEPQVQAHTSRYGWVRSRCTHSTALWKPCLATSKPSRTTVRPVWIAKPSKPG